MYICSVRIENLDRFRNRTTKLSSSRTGQPVLELAVLIKNLNWFQNWTSLAVLIKNWFWLSRSRTQFKNWTRMAVPIENKVQKLDKAGWDRYIQYVNTKKAIFFFWNLHQTPWTLHKPKVVNKTQHTYSNTYNSRHICGKTNLCQSEMVVHKQRGTTPNMMSIVP